MRYFHVFGPVYSGRLGRSLGLDLLGDRVCSMDCTYCEVGSTVILTMDRASYVPAKTILDELSHWKDAGHELPDVITLGGFGEPCLNSEMPAVIAGIRELFPSIPVAVLTNSTLLIDPVVRRELCAVDIVLPSMDSLIADEFRAVNRPHPDVEPEQVAEALVRFRKEFTGKVFLELLLVRGVNDSAENLRAFHDFCSRLGPDRVDVMTLSRPGSEKKAEAVDADVLNHWRDTLGAGEADRLARQEARSGEDARGYGEDKLREMILASVSRRPQTADDMARAMGADRESVDSLVKRMDTEGILQSEESEGKTFYWAGADRAR